MCFEACLEHLLKPVADTGHSSSRLEFRASFPLTTVVVVLRPVPAATSRSRFRQRKALRALVHVAAQPGSCESFLFWHTSSREAQAHEYLKRSLFHAGAARGLVQRCARLLAAGFRCRCTIRERGMDSVARGSCPRRVGVLVCGLLFKPKLKLVYFYQAHLFQRAFRSVLQLKPAFLLFLHCQFSALYKSNRIHELSLSLFLCLISLQCFHSVGKVENVRCQQQSVESWRKRTSTCWSSQRASKWSLSAGHVHKQFAQSQNVSKGTLVPFQFLRAISKRYQMEMRWRMLLPASNFDRGKINSGAVLSFHCQSVTKLKCVAECYLWSRNVSEAKVTPT